MLRPMGGSGSARRAQGGAPSPRRSVRAAAWASVVLLATGCALLPDEFNLSPIYRHRMDADGSVREMDVLWPIFHYRKTEDDGWEFRVRPLYRYVSETPELPADEHQFVWPLGRVYNDEEETRARFFPLWRYSSRPNDEGLRETDWYFAILLWGGTREDGQENYFAFLPFYADIPDFLTYDRFQAHLFPLHVGLEKADVNSHLFLWPLIGFGSNEEGTKFWHRILPLYGVTVDEERYERYTALWPFFHWGTEGLDTDDPISRFFFFPFWGQQDSNKVSAWTVLWPFFQKIASENSLFKLDLFWPIFRYQAIERTNRWMRQWWVWPFVGNTVTQDRDAWSLLWPFIWLSEYDDPDGTQNNDWVLPFYWRVRKDRTDGKPDDYTKFWPLYHSEELPSGESEAQFPSPWLWRASYADGVDAHYGWIWTLAKSRATPTSHNFDLAAHLYTSSERDGRSQSSVPLLFNYESDGDGATLRLLQFLPIPWWGGGDD